MGNFQAAYSQRLRQPENGVNGASASSKPHDAAFVHGDAAIICAHGVVVEKGDGAPLRVGGFYAVADGQPETVLQRAGCAAAGRELDGFGRDVVRGGDV